jgi:hypothetical protein
MPLFYKAQNARAAVYECGNSCLRGGREGISKRRGVCFVKNKIAMRYQLDLEKLKFCNRNGYRRFRCIKRF